jgi:hypothetical protein
MPASMEDLINSIINKEDKQMEKFKIGQKVEILWSKTDEVVCDLFTAYQCVPKILADTYGIDQCVIFETDYSRPQKLQLQRVQPG